MDPSQIKNLRRWNIAAIAIHGVSTISQVALFFYKSKWRFRLTQQEYPDYAEAGAKALQETLLDDETIRNKRLYFKVDYNKDGFPDNNDSNDVIK